MIAPEDDLTAGEYAVGSLGSDERAAASLRRQSDPDFEAAVVAWEDRLAPLSEIDGEAVPSAEVWSAILARIKALGIESVHSVPRGQVIELGRQVRLWKRATAGALALAAALALWIAVGSPIGSRQAGQPLVALLQTSNEAPAFVMTADLVDRRLSVRPVAANPMPGKSYELWIIDPDIGAPKSLGVLGQDGPSGAALPNIAAAVLSRATYAVTVEAPGGSSTGKPTSAPVFFGHLVGTGL